MSPDLNPMKNMWGNLSRKVYRDGRQFQSLEQLKDRIKEYWDEINTEECRILINSIQNRLFEVIRKNGKYISY